MSAALLAVCCCCCCFLKDHSASFYTRHGQQQDLYQHRVRHLRHPGGALGVPGVEHRLQTAVDRGDGRPVRCVGALGPGHAHHVPAGLLAHLAQGPEVLHRRGRALLGAVGHRLHHLPHSGHHAEAVAHRPEEPLPHLRVELHDPQVVLPPGLVLLPIPPGVCRHQHPQRLLGRYPLLSFWFLNAQEAEGLKRTLVGELFVTKEAERNSNLNVGSTTTTKKVR